MHPSPLVPLSGPFLRARLRLREKRFILHLAALDGPQSGQEITAHINDPGRLPILQPGAEVWLRGPFPAPAKLAWRASLLRIAPDAWVSLDTTLANHIAFALCAQSKLPGLPPGAPLREVKRGDSRFDLLWPLPDGREHIAEVKTASMVYPNGMAGWPDAPSTRALKHLQHLTAHVQRSQPASLLFVAYHPSVTAITPAADIDPNFTKALKVAAAEGVQLLGYRAVARPEGIFEGRPVPVILDPSPAP